MFSPSTGRWWLKLTVVLAFLPTLVLADVVKPEKIVPAADSRNDSPAIAFDADGTLWIAWASYQGGRYRLAVASRSADGKISEIDYPDDSATDQVDAVWAFAPDGTPQVVYAVHDGSQWTIRKVKCSKQGAGSKPEVVGQGTKPTAVVADGRLWLAWDQDPNVVMVAPGEKATKTILKPSDGMTRLTSPTLAAGPDGAVWLAWEAVRPDYRSVRLQRIDEPGHSAMTVDDGTGINRHPSMSIAADGRVWLVFEHLETDDPLGGGPRPKSKGPAYIYDRTYPVTKPSRVVVVTDGKQRWTTADASAPAWGLGPSLLCSADGTVWLLSQRYIDFYPICESLGPAGWHNHHAAWSKQRSDKQSMPLAAAPDGKVWTAWVEQHRKRSRDPFWTVLDGPDTILLAAMPEAKSAGKPRLIPKPKATTAAASPVALPQYSTDYEGEKLNVYFGDLHVHSEFSLCGRTNGAIEEDVAYSRDVRGLDFYAPGDHAEHLNDHNWRETLMALRRHDKPGVFVPFMAFEWTSEFDNGGNLYRGHYNPIFRQLDGGERYFSASRRETNTPLELWTALRKAVGGPENVITFPHHTSRRYAWLSWCYYDPEMVPLIEIAQTRGSYEYEGCPRGSRMAGDCARVSGHYIRNGLERGMRFGFASNGDHAGRNLTAVYAPKLDRDSLFEAMRAKRVYGTNGWRMLLDTRVNGHFMGEEFRADGDTPRTITIRAKGTTPLTHVDVFRNGRVVRQWNCQGTAFRGKFVDTEPLVARENYYYVRVMQQGDGIAWSSPNWIVNTDVPGEFRFQVGRDEFHVAYGGEESDYSILTHNETDEPVEAAVSLEVPEGWAVKEEMPIKVTCPPGGWRHAVFNATPPNGAFTKLCLPKVVAHCRRSDGTTESSPLFVVGSPMRLGTPDKPMLIDARVDLTPEQFERYLEKMDAIWKKR